MTEPEPIKYCSYCGREIEERRFEGRSRPYCLSCDRFFFQDPKVAAAALIEHEGRVLLVKRRFNPEMGKWGLPAGFVDAGEDPKVALVRECREETGLNVRILRLMDVIFDDEHARGANIVILYQAEVEGGAISAGDDAEEVAFFPPDQLPPIAFRATRKALDLWLSPG
ncbi:MAG: NUDIX domain-containing protein [Anaerolineales bacterium]|nr:NUDIX domain-containing protein [Anaerolineales bacterium]